MSWKERIKRFFRHKRHTIAHQRRACAVCGREVAHTQDGRAFLHKCEPSAIPFPAAAERKESA